MPRGAGVNQDKRSTSDHPQMTYEESFLSTCDAEGFAPGWAVSQIFKEHNTDVDEYIQSTPEAKWFNGETILNWLGY